MTRRPGRRLRCAAPAFHAGPFDLPGLLPEPPVIPPQAGIHSPNYRAYRTPNS